MDSPVEPVTDTPPVDGVMIIGSEEGVITIPLSGDGVITICTGEGVTTIPSPAGDLGANLQNSITFHFK